MSSSVYRIFASILATRLSGYMHDGPVAARLEDAQFGFRKELSTEQAHLVLVTACEAALASGKELALVRLDISKAYDRVDRNILWDALRQDMYPPTFIYLLQEMYREVPYVVKVNGERSCSFIPDEGLPQGDSTSPPEFNTYSKRIIRAIERECAHIGITFNVIPAVTITNVTFADDITGTIQSNRVADFLRVVERVLTEHKLSLSRAKCKVLLISSQPRQVQTTGGLPVVPVIKILGLKYDSAATQFINVQDRKERGKSKVILHISRLSRSGCLHDIDISRLMSVTDIGPILLYGACIWGHTGIKHLVPMQHELQKVYNILPRSTLKVPHSTAHWIGTMICGLTPIQDQIIQSFAKFWNRTLPMMQTNTLIDASLKQQLTMHTAQNPCWMSNWIKALNLVVPAMGLEHVITTLQPIDLHTLDSTLAATHKTYLDACGDPFTAGYCPHRKTALVHRMLGVGREWGKIPRLLRIRVPDRSTKITWHKFLSSWAKVPSQDLVLLNTMLYHQRLCQRCPRQHIGSEQHVLLHCTHTAQVRTNFGTRLQWHNSLTTFLESNQTSRALPEFVFECLSVYNPRHVNNPAGGQGGEESD